MHPVDRRNITMPRLLCSLLLTLTASTPLTVGAQSDGKAPWNSYGDRIKSSQEVSPLGPDLFGDQISLSNGGLSFTATDVSVPGNSSIPVALTRRYQVKDWRHRIADGMLKDWDLDLPNVSATFASEWVGKNFSTGQLSAARCSDPHRPPLPANFDGLTWQDFWHGVQINIPGVTGGELLQQGAGSTTPSTGGPYPWMTNDQVQVSCLPTIKNGSGAYGNGGEGFLAITPNGTKYWFDWMARSHEAPLKRGSFIQSQTTFGYSLYWSQELPIHRYALYATRIEDRFGNAVELTYSNAWNQPARLTSIKDAPGGEGRQITVAYSGGAISSVTDGTRTWSYAYGSTGSGRGTLTSVAQSTPDNPNSNVWAINFAQFTNAEIIYPEASVEGSRNCFMLQDPSNYSLMPVGTITHPSGAVGTFTMKLKEHNRSGVPVNCDNIVIPDGHEMNDENDDTPRYPFSSISLTLDSKSISGPNLTTALWTYSYESDRSDWFVRGATFQRPRCTLSLQSDCAKPVCTSYNDDCRGESRTTVRGPNNEWVHYAHGNIYGFDEGKLKAVDVGTGAGPTYDAQKRVTNSIQRTTNSYDLSRSGMAVPTNWGWSQQLEGDGFQDEYRRPWTGTVIRLQGVDFSRQATLDAFDRPSTEVQSSITVATGATVRSRTEVTEYHDNLSLWVLGQVQRVRVTAPGNEIQTSRTEFNALALPIKQRGVGDLLLQEISYHANGVPHTIKDGKGNTTAATNWYRGLPRLVTYADNTTQSAIVNALGWIMQVTDQNSNVTNYDYDTVGRLKLIQYPTGDSVAWNSTNLSFAKLTAAELGFPVGTWRLQTNTGTGYKRTYFDAMWRPRLTHEYDSANPTGTRRYSAWSYDGNGRTTFAAYPLATATSPASFTQGVWSEYDALGRITSVAQDSEHGLLTTTTDYLTDFKTRVTNPRLNATTTSFFTWGSPDTSMPWVIQAPENTTTTMTRDLRLGFPTAVTRSGTWSGGSQSLARNYYYDGQQRLRRTYSPEEGTRYHEYDAAQNLIWTVECPANSQASCDGVAATERTVRTYDVMNRVELIDYPGTTNDISTTYEADGAIATVANGPVGIEYGYNKRGLLTSERLLWGSVDWTFGHGYTANGHHATTTYADGETVSFAPNALGQATQAGTYATGAAYFPNGALKQFTYGNGIVHTLVQNERQLPERSQDLLGATKILDDTYDYDYNGNVAGITDALSGQPGNRAMSYDALDRLLGVTAGSAQGGNAVFAYDVVDNIRQLDQGTRTVRHQYDASNRLSAVKNAAGTTLYGVGHDTRGNLISRDFPVGNDDSFTFDRANRLTASTVGGVNNTYTYDGLGRRVREVEAASTYFYYGQSGQLLYTRDLKTSTRHNHIYLADSLVAKRSGGLTGAPTSTRYQHTDALGSPVAETSETGMLTRRERMTAYGEPADGTWQSGPGFTGHQMDAGSKLVYMQQRYYDPAFGRFLSIDPVTALDNGDMRHFNRYAYAYGSPYNFTDPDGREGACMYGPSMCGMRETAPEDAAMQGKIVEGVAIAGGVLLLRKSPAAVRALFDGLRRGARQESKSDIPEKAREVVDFVTKNNGRPPEGFRGGREFKNDGRAGGQTLPKTDSSGNKITYREYDVNPYQQGVNRGAERVVRGSDGKSYYTADHYKTFQEVKPK